MKVRAYVAGDQVGKTVRSVQSFSRMARDALREAAADAAESIEGKGRADIGAAGNFGGRWTSGFNATVSEGGGNVKIDVTEAVPYWTVFQYGATIVGKPLLYFKPTQAVGGLTGKDPLPLVISKHAVSIPKKFHLIEISAAEAAKVPLLFRQNMKAAKAAAKG
jgi:hypothetical protein